MSNPSTIQTRRSLDGCVFLSFFPVFSQDAVLLLHKGYKLTEISPQNHAVGAYFLQQDKAVFDAGFFDFPGDVARVS